MARLSKSDVIQKMTAAGMVPVFNHADVDTARHVIDAAYQGGLRAFEFTNRGANAFEVFVELVKHVQKYPDLALGIGTIMDAAATKKFIDAGADFIVSPILKAEIGTVCKEHDMLWIPGGGTVTEVVTARDLGAEVIKIFPGSVLGPEFISAILPVMPGLQLMPTGGVDPSEENLKGWFNAGVACVGMGSQLFRKDWIEKKEWKMLEVKIQSTLKTIEKLRKK